MNSHETWMAYSAFHRRSSEFIGSTPLDSRWEDYEMRKGFTRKPQTDEPATPVKNYITRSGLQRLKDEQGFLLTRERPAVTEVVAWAASNGDRSENADYQYGKRRLRQIDGRIRFARSESKPRKWWPRKLRERAGGDEGILRSDCALCQCRGSGASGEHRWHRRNRSQQQTTSVGITSGPSVD